MSRKVLNAQVLEAWKEIDPKDWRIHVDDIIVEFLKVGPIQFQALRVAWADRDALQLKRAAHAMKSSCGLVGAEQAYDLLNNIENSSSEKIGDFYEMLKEFRLVFDQTCEELKDYKHLFQAA